MNAELLDVSIASLDDVPIFQQKLYALELQTHPDQSLQLSIHQVGQLWQKCSCILSSIEFNRYLLQKVLSLTSPVVVKGMNGAFAHSRYVLVAPMRFFTVAFRRKVTYDSDGKGSLDGARKSSASLSPIAGTKTLSTYQCYQQVL